MDVGGTDALLAARLAAGDDHALAEVFDRLGAAVYGAALRVMGNGAAAQDVVQDVFVELWSHPGRYDPAAGTLRTFLMVQARCRAVDMVRSELRRIARQERHHQLTPGQQAPSPCEQVTAAQAASAVRAAVRQLPEGQRRVVELAYFKGMTCREVALAARHPGGYRQVAAQACAGQAGNRAGPAVAGVVMTAERGPEPTVLPAGLRERVLAASWQARAVGRSVPEVPEISAAEALSRATDAFYGLLCALGDGDWPVPALRSLNVQGLVGHLIGVEDDVRRCLSGDPEVAGASHVESTQPAAERQAGRPAARTRADWRHAADRTLDLVRPAGDPCAEVAVHGVCPPAERAAGGPGVRAVDTRQRHPPGDRAA